MVRNKTASTVPSPCDRSEVEHVRKFLSCVKGHVNRKAYYPPVDSHRYLVALALYSKCITVAEASLVLLSAGFSDEAFGMTRTLLDIFFTLRYIANRDTDERARLYVEFAAKDKVVWSELFKTYWPHIPQPSLSVHTLRIASRFPSPHRWSGKSIKDMALEPDTVEVDANARPVIPDFAGRGIYRWASHYVHPTIPALSNHLVQAGQDVFVVRSGHGDDMTHLATFNAASGVAHTMIYFYRCMGDEQPARVSKWAAALLKHLAQCHK
jgi:hypothetical protein